MAKLRRLKTSSGGLFVFGPKTVSLDVSRICGTNIPEPGVGRHDDPAKPGTVWLHVGRTKAALDWDWTVDELELDAAWDIIRREESRRFHAGEPTVESLFDPRLWREARRQAEHLAAGRAATRPLGTSRERICLDSVGGHPDEFLGLDRNTARAAIETVKPELDARGRPAGYNSSTRVVSAAEALEWIRTDGVRTMSGQLLDLLEDAARRERK